MLWTQGFERESATGLGWEPLLRDRLLARFAGLPRADTTVAAEAGLGIPPSSYWYILYSHHAFGRILILAEPETSTLRSLTGGATPFDSGGLWHGHIKGAPPFGSEADRTAYFSSSCTALPATESAVTNWVQSGYDTPTDYVIGLPPKHLDRIINSSATNDPRAWSWEAHISSLDYSPHPVTPQKVILSPEDARYFPIWLQDEDNSLKLHEQRQLLMWCANNLVPAANPLETAIDYLSRASGP